MAASEGLIARTERVEKASGLRLFWYAMWARAYPRIIGAARERSWLFFETLMPVLAVAGYVFIYRAIQAPPEYTGFAVLGGAMTAFWLNILWSMASQLYRDKDAGTRAITILVVCSVLFGVTYQVTSPLLLAGVFIVTMAALYGMGMLFASVFLVAGREAWHLSNLMQEPIYLVSGFYFPVRALGFWTATAASIIPLTLGMDAMRQLIFAGGPALGFLSVPLEVGILVVLAVVFIGAAGIALARLEMVGRREGRIIGRRR